jgi:kynureninase
MPDTEVFYQKAIELDNQDKLKRFRDQFFIDDENLIYLDGNSLGRLPKMSRALISEIVDKQWGSSLINSWNEHWMDLPIKLASKIAKLIGAREDEVFVGDTTSLNLYKLLYSALSINPEKTKIISDTLNFPTDLYIIQGLIAQQFKDHKLQLLESENGIEVSESMISKAMDEHTSLVTLSHVLFKSSFMYNMKRINEIVHENKSLIVWDLSHSVGAVPINLNESNADMAVGCTYKYLNGGPGAPAFLYVKKELQEKMKNPISAWFSHAKPFDFSLDYQSVNSIGMFATGTPSVLSLAAIEPGLDILLAAGMNDIRNKSIKQSEFMIEMIQKLLIPLSFTIASPLKSEYRGSHISIQHAEAYRISQAMIDPKNDSKSIIPDFRPPNNIRLGIAPLYNSFIEIYETIIRIRDIVVEKQYLEYDLKRKHVT